VGGMHREGAKVHCHSTWGHGGLTLEDALLHSCNAYFAMVGERPTTTLQASGTWHAPLASIGPRACAPWTTALGTSEGCARMHAPTGSSRMIVRPRHPPCSAWGMD
jgi:hypothetical protein